MPPETELSMLRRAQAALATAPDRALELARSHQERYGEGLLAQEREVIAIEALMRLGRVPEANQRTRDFSRRYPGSAHQRRIDRLFVSAPPAEP
jgi:hypothetical protein